MRNAIVFPTIWPGDKEFPTIIIIPAIARIIDASVILEIFSLRNRYPNIARNIVCVCIIKLVLVTVVLYIAKT